MVGGLLFGGGGYYALSLFLLKNDNPLLLLKALFCFAIVIAFFIRNSAFRIDKRVISFIVTLAHVSVPLLVQPYGIATIPLRWSIFIFIVGLLLSSFSVVDLWKSFGLLPANRGIVSGGVYSLIRHPIYLGYFLLFIGVISHYLSLLNFVLFILFIVLTVLRIRLEEFLLQKDENYLLYSKKVRFKLIPWVF